MKQKVFFTIFLCMLMLGMAEEMPTGTPRVKDGYALLDSLVTIFRDLPIDKGLKAVSSRLENLLGDVQASREANQIDAVYYNRYRRILFIFKLIITPMKKNNLWEPIIFRELTAFVRDTTGENWEWGNKKSVPKMARALEEEFINLQIYLDTRETRKKLRQKWDGKMLPPPMKKK